MKKIAFFVQHMICGGVENSLINLIEMLPDEYQPVVYVIKNNGEFIDEIPDRAKVLEIPLSEKLRNSIPVGGTKVALRDAKKNKKYVQALGYLKNHIFGKSDFSELNIDFKSVPLMNDSFDIAVCYHLHSPFILRYVSEKVKADKKFAWVHNDFKTTGYKLEKLEEYLIEYDRFYLVSNQLMDEFVELYPEYKGKSRVMQNIIPKKRIIRLSENESAPELNDDEIFKILTVGRLEEQKGYLLAIEACRKLKDSGIRFQWFVLGEGTQRKEIEKKIKEYGLEKNFVLLGVRKNPYPYYRACDIYVQPSIHEGFGIAVAEAKVLCKPIVCTDFIGAKEQIINGNTGSILSINSDDISDEIIFLIRNKDVRNLYSENLKKMSKKFDMDHYLLEFT